MKKLEVTDPVHGEITVLEEETFLMDTPEMQRLRNLRQLPTVHFAYPGGTHSRFAHSLGVLELATRIARNVGIAPDSREMRWLRVAALLDDIDEPPFYPIFKEFYPANYDSISTQIRRRLVEQACARANSKTTRLGQSIDTDAVLKIMLKETSSIFYTQIIKSEVGADRLDYLIRDAYCTGAAFGSGLDLRIISHLRRNEKLAIEADAIPLVDHLFSIMFQMKRRVYDHKVARAALVILDQSLSTLFSKGHPLKSFLVRSSSPNLILEDDMTFLTKIGRLDPNLIQRFSNRDFPHCVYTTDARQLKPEVANTLNLLRDKRLAAERDLSKGANAKIMLDFVSSAWRIAPAIPIETYQEGIAPESLADSKQLERWYSTNAHEPFPEWRMNVFCDDPDLTKRETTTKYCRKQFQYLHVGSVRPTIEPISLLEQAYKVADGELKPQAVLSFRRAILTLQPHIRLTLEKLVELGSPATASEVSHLTGRSRVVESLYLNQLTKDNLKSGTPKLLEKEPKHAKEQRFKLVDQRLAAIIQEFLDLKSDAHPSRKRRPE